MTGTAAEPRVPSAEEIRAAFPTLQAEFAYLENAGGSQMPACVSDAIYHYTRSTYVQIGAGYPASREATAVVQKAHETMSQWMNAGQVGKVVLGPSSTALINIVANAYGEILNAGDEVVICDTNHEANAGPWERLGKLGVKILHWRVDPDSFECFLDDLDRLLSDRTRIVAFPHVSNLLGEVVDVKAITKLCHDRGAKVFVDGVAFAPHGLIDVEDWGVDWYIFSNYKVYGPQMASLFGTHEAFEELTGPNHFFIPKESVPGKWELGALNHEGCAGIVALNEYAEFVAGGRTGRKAVQWATKRMSALEKPLTDRLIRYLESKHQVRIIGPGSARESVGTISFVADPTESQTIADHLATRNIGIRAGHMYAVRLCRALGIDLAQGVVRISLLHYNSQTEIDRTIEALEEIL